MSYNLVQQNPETGELYLKNIAGGGGGAIVEGKPIYGERKQYDTNKKMPLAGQASLKYTMDRDGILTGSCHKAGQGYSAWMRMNGKILTTFDNYGGESCSFDFPNVRVKAGDIIELTTNVPTTETTNFFWLNNIGVTPIVGVEPGIELQAQDTYSLEEIKVGEWIDGKPIYRKVFHNTDKTKFVMGNGNLITFGNIGSDFDSVIKFSTIIGSVNDSGQIDAAGSWQTENCSWIKCQANGDITVNSLQQGNNYYLRTMIVEYTKK